MEISHHFIEEVKKIIDDSRIKAIRSVDHIRVRMYWELGRKKFLKRKIEKMKKGYIVRT